MCKKVCSKCPFSKKSLPGWLGPYDVDSILFAQQFDSGFACHTHIEEESSIEDVLNGDIPICRGFVASASASHKLFGQLNTNVSKGLKSLQEEITEEDKENVLNRNDFRIHHTISMTDF